MTARELIAGSLRLLGVLASGQSIPAADAQDALFALNSMLDSWSTEALSVMGSLQYEVVLKTAQTMYTVGDGGDIDMPMPSRLDDMAVIYPGGQDSYIPVRELTQSEYAAITVVGFQTQLPQAFFADRTYPLMQLYFYPMPYAGTKIRFFVDQKLEFIPNIGSELQISTGYAKAIRYNLALELAPEYGVEPSSLIAAQAATSKANIQVTNASQDIILGVDPGLTARGGYNIRTGSWK